MGAAVRLDKLTTTEAPVEIKLDPRLTVLIGGRGSGKSSVVAALRCLYGDVEALPSQARAEMDGLLEAVFPDATLDGTHCLAYSGEQQTARWTHETGSISHRNAQESGDLPPDAMRCLQTSRSASSTRRSCSSGQHTAPTTVMPRLAIY